MTVRCRHRWTALTKHKEMGADVDTGKDYCYLCGEERIRPEAKLPEEVEQALKHHHIDFLHAYIARQDKAMREMAKLINCDSGCPLRKDCRFISRRDCDERIFTHYLGGK